MDRHRLAEETSIRLHAEIAARIPTDPTIVERALQRARGWAATGAVAKPYAAAWVALLEGPLEELLRTLADQSEAARALRQVSPFAGALGARERWALWKRARAELSEP
ncbi:MAG: hypothetical protein KF901_27295 [Myxococcales bacterium]|nr:hypothetical protein [Myxococcales bacterium]